MAGTSHPTEDALLQGVDRDYYCKVDLPVTEFPHRKIPWSPVGLSCLEKTHCNRALVAEVHLMRPSAPAKLRLSSSQHHRGQDEQTFSAPHSNRVDISLPTSSTTDVANLGVSKTTISFHLNRATASIHGLTFPEETKHTRVAVLPLTVFKQLPLQQSISSLRFPFAPSIVASSRANSYCTYRYLSSNPPAYTPRNYPKNL